MADEELGFGDEELGFGEEELGFGEDFGESLPDTSADLSTFDGYAKAKFQGGNDGNYSREALKVALLPEAKVKSALAVFAVIQRFMGDAEDPKKMATLEKIQFVLGSGIAAAPMRDEIYAQMMKQLTRNPSRTSHARGWVLLSCIVGSFVPKDPQLLAVFEKFLESGPPSFSAYVKERVARTKANGMRHQPISHMEFQAVKAKKPFNIDVIMMDKKTHTLPCDSATTAAELHKELASRTFIKSTQGFSFMIAFGGKIFAIRDARNHIMDAVAQVEQAGTKGKKGKEQEVQWTLFYRKEEVQPGFDAKADPAHTKLIYYQLIAGIKCQKYGIDADQKQLAELASKHFYVLYQDHMSQSALEKMLKSTLIPDKLLKKRKVADWCQEVEKLHARAAYTRSKMPVEEVMAEVVTAAIKDYPKLFTQFYEAKALAEEILASN